MNRLGWMLLRILIIGALAAGSLRCEAESSCTVVRVEAEVEAGRGELSLADLLAPGTCPQWRAAAEKMGLGAVPRAGNIRVLDGGQIRGLLEELAGGSSSLDRASVRFPERIVVRRAGAAKSCAEIARFVASAAALRGMTSAAGPWSEKIAQEKMDCAAIPNMAEDTPLELIRTSWNPGLHRWEFALRCVRAEDCVPFLLWLHEENTLPARLPGAPSGALAARAPGAGSGGNGPERLVKRGQTASLTWDQSGIRVVLPVTCLDGGGLGQFVRVQFKNAPRIVRAEILSDGTLRASP